MLRQGWRTRDLVNLLGFTLCIRSNSPIKDRRDVKNIPTYSLLNAEDDHSKTVHMTSYQSFKTAAAYMRSMWVVNVRQKERYSRYWRHLIAVMLLTKDTHEMVHCSIEHPGLTRGTLSWEE